MKKYNFFSFKFENDKFVFLDQTGLPNRADYVETDNFERIAEAIEKLEIRGAPAIGIAAAYGLALSLKNGFSDLEFEAAYYRLGKTRPTAVNLFWAPRQMRDVYFSIKDHSSVYQQLLEHAKSIHAEEDYKSEQIANHGRLLFNDPSTILTHCNTGAFAAGGFGTALAIIKKVADDDLIQHVYVDETRPLFQGSRLTAYELHAYDVPFSIITDSMAASVMKNKSVHAVIVGADRIAANGDSANKIGTYSLAVLCKYHSIPFYIAAPTSTIDRSIPSGEKIIIEEREPLEILSFRSTLISARYYQVYNPAFDVTPADLITAIITEKGISRFPYSF